MKKHSSPRGNGPRKFSKGHPSRNNANRFAQSEGLLTIAALSSAYLDKIVTLQGTIERIVQTPGPTIFSIDDATGMFNLKKFEGPGERAYPDLTEGAIVKITAKITEFNGSLEGEILKLSAFEGDAAETIRKSMLEQLRKRAAATEVPFLIESPILEKLRDRMIKAATEIRLAIMQNRPIIVRHHNDADGYSSGYALERAIIPLIQDQHKTEKAAWEFFVRAPCAAPFYEIDDSIRDTASSLRNVAKFSNKIPLVIIADNGASQEDLFAIKQAKVHGMDFVVVDHHPFGEKDVISPEVLVNINPFLVDESGSAFSAGMLCTELARFINKDVQNILQIPAMAGYADRIDYENPAAMEAYLKIAEQEGYSKELSADIALVLDFVSAKLRFMEAREYIEVIFGEPRKQQEELVKLMVGYIRELDAKGLEMARAARQLKPTGKTVIQWLPIDGNFPGFGFFPKPGRCVSMVHDDAEKDTKALVTVGLMAQAMTIRATDEANFSVADFIQYVRKECPHAFAEGGGHKNAGSINFIASKQQDVVMLLEMFVKSRQ